MLLLVLCMYVAWRNPRFLSAYNLQNQAQLIGMYGIFSIGMGIVIITGGIDLSVGSIFALQGVVLSILLVDRHWAWPLAALAAILGVVALGICHGFLITKVRLQPFIVTLCGLLIYRGMARWIANDETKGFGAGDFGWLRPISTGHFGPPDWVSHIFTALGKASWLPERLTYLCTSLGKVRVPMAFDVMLVIAFIMFIVLHRSVYGRYLYAVGRNEEAAKYSGINTKLIIGSAYALSGPWRRYPESYLPSTPIRSPPARTATPTNYTASPPPFWADAVSAAARAPSSESSSEPPCSRCSRISSYCWAFPAHSIWPSSERSF